VGSEVPEFERKSLKLAKTLYFMKVKALVQRRVFSLRKPVKRRANKD
jgi:hypothetical protein